MTPLAPRTEKQKKPLSAPKKDEDKYVETGSPLFVTVESPSGTVLDGK